MRLIKLCTLKKTLEIQFIFTYECKIIPLSRINIALSEQYVGITMIWFYGIKDLIPRH